MENGIVGFTFYIGKIGIDNLLLMCVGILYLAVYYQTQRDHVDADLHWRTAIFFFVYAITFDLYRIKPLRPFLLFNTRDYQLYQSAVLMFSLLFLYDGLVHRLLAIWRDKRNTRRRKNSQK